MDNSCDSLLSNLFSFPSSSTSPSSSSSSTPPVPPLPTFPPAVTPPKQRPPTYLHSLLRALSLTDDRSDSESEESDDNDDDISEEEGGEQDDADEGELEEDESEGMDEEEEESQVEVIRADADEDELLSAVRKRIEQRKKDGKKQLEGFDLKWKQLVEEEQKQGWSRERTPLQEHHFVPRAPPPPPNCTTPLDFFNQLFPVAFVDAVVERTNSYAVARHLHRKENTGRTVDEGCGCVLTARVVFATGPEVEEVVATSGVVPHRHGRHQCECAVQSVRSYTAHSTCGSEVLH
jgi:hypothetical protein